MIVSEQVGYEKIGKFHEGRAKVYKKGLIGFIDTDVNFITPIRWEDASDFCEGLACVADPESGSRFGICQHELYAIYRTLRYSLVQW